MALYIIHDQGLIYRIYDELMMLFIYEIKPMCFCLQVTHLIEMSSGTRTCKYAIAQDKILTWLVDNRVLSIALEGTFYINLRHFKLVLVV